jgi:hypothetical protein
MSATRKIVTELLERAGETYAEQAGIRLKDTPAPLYRVLVLAVLLSTRIRADIAVEATRELVRSGMGTPRRMRAATWQQRVDALGRAHYVRYDESTATALGEGAELVLDRWKGDLRRLREESGGDPAAVRDLLTEVPRLGPTGADIFCREVQSVWPQLRPAVDGKAAEGAQRLGLPTDPHDLAALVPDAQLASLVAALIRVALEKGLAQDVLAAA